LTNLRALHHDREVMWEGVSWALKYVSIQDGGSHKQVQTQEHHDGCGSSSVATGRSREGSTRHRQIFQLSM